MSTCPSLNNLCYVGIDFSLCPVEMRELWALALQSDQDFKRTGEFIRQHLGAQAECVVVSTCNRFDLILHGAIHEVRVKNLFLELLPEASRLKIKSPLPLRYFKGIEALNTLMRVACSLESLVVGEPHILGQVKQAFFRSQNLKISGKYLNIFFRHCFTVAKKVRTETALGKHALSVGHAAVDMVQRVFSNLNERKILVVGAGEMAKLSAQYVLDCHGQVYLCNRTKARAEQLASELTSKLNPQRIEVLDYSDALRNLFAFDVVMCATGASAPVITAAQVASIPQKRSGDLMVFVDVGVPRNIDHKIKDFDNILLFDIDDLAKIMDQNRLNRQSAMNEAQEIIQANLKNFSKQEAMRAHLLPVAQLHRWYFSLIHEELLKESPQLLPERASILAASLAKKLVSPLAKNIRENAPHTREQTEPFEDLVQLITQGKKL